jgi:hypothetical protein
MSNLLDAIWVEYLDRDSATTDAESADVEFKLLTAARAERRFAAAWAVDQALDCQLRTVNHLLETEDAFVAEWERRLQNLTDSAVAEPPIGAPPAPSAAVTSVQIFTSAPRATMQRRTIHYQPQMHTTAAIVGSVALLALVAIAFWIFRGDGDLARHEKPLEKLNVPVAKDSRVVDPTKLPQEENPADAPFRFVLPKPKSEPERILPVVWQTGGPQDNRLPRGEHRLQSGIVELVGGKATPVTISAPAAVKVGDDDSWFVQQGTVSVRDLPSGERLPISTPNSRIHSQGAEFVVNVNAAGQTDVQVRRGEVHLLPGAAGASAEPLKLLAGEFERALLSPVGKEPGEQPAFCQLRGPEDRFCGLIELAGKSLRFASPEDFQEFQKQVEEQFAKDAAELREQWPDLVRALGGLGGGEIQLERDGQPLEIQTLEQLLDFLKQLPAPPGAGLPQPAPAKPGEAKPGLPKPGAARGAGSGFQGTIIINGEEQKFNSQEEFNAARKKMLEQFGPLPIDPFEQLKQFDLPADVLPK